MIELHELADALLRGNVRYLLCGGLAVNIYGVQRSTGDIDILLDFEEGNIRRFLSAIKQLHYTNTLPLHFEELIDEPTRKQHIKERNLIAYSFYSTVRGRMTLAVLVDVPLEFEGLWERRDQRSYEGTPVHLVSREDLIALKTYAGREQDKQDVILLSKST